MLVRAGRCCLGRVQSHLRLPAPLGASCCPRARCLAKSVVRRNRWSRSWGFWSRVSETRTPVLEDVQNGVAQVEEMMGNRDGSREYESANKEDIPLELRRQSLDRPQQTQDAAASSSFERRTEM